jgi:uncharacterized protein YigE (DUF2233 family)
MNTQGRLHIFIALLTIVMSPLILAESSWKNLRFGLAYQDLAPAPIHDWSHIHVFKIDLKHYRFELVQHHQTEHHFPTMHQYAEHQHAPLTFNGGFFDKKQQPLGLRISNHHQLNPFKNISWWGVFYIEHGRPYIKSARNFHQQKSMEFAIQSGPRLLVNGHIPSLHHGYAERTALCILPNHEVAVIITQYYPADLTHLAQILKKAPLHCQNAINLDGGSSTQFFAKFSGFYRYMSGITSVSDAITVIPRSSN